jgi:hypothetical protein
LAGAGDGVANTSIGGNGGPAGVGASVAVAARVAACVGVGVAAASEVDARGIGSAEADAIGCTVEDGLAHAATLAASAATRSRAGNVRPIDRTITARL